MTGRDRRRSTELHQRLDHLRQVADLAPGRVPPAVVAGATDVLDRAGSRLAHGASHTVVAVAGATGSGKSSLFNALVGSAVADVGVRRPTTSTAQAAVFGGGAAELLDWLEVPRRHEVAGGDLDGLVLLDLPDHDSVEAAHRREVDRLVEVVDTFLWVVDPQKYADAALHQQYLARFATHGAVTIVALNQVDLVPGPQERRELVGDVGRLVAADGLAGVRVVATSTRTGEGIDALRRELAARVTERHALIARLDADIDWLVDDLRAAVGDVEPPTVDRHADRGLVDSLSYAAGVEALADAVGAAHRHRSVQQVGWPPLRWTRRLRPDPLRRLGLDRARGGDEPPSDDAVVVARTSRDRPSSVADAAVDQALRETADAVSYGLPDRWVDRVRTATAGRRDDLADALDVAVSSARLPTGQPRWWAAARAVQWALAAATAVGLLWLVVIGVVAWLGLPDLPTPEIEQVPYPTALLLGGAAAGLLLAALARWAASFAARRRAARARRELRRQVQAVAERLVLEPLEAELADLRELRARVRSLDDRQLARS